jgi:hypothetical protein
MKPEVLEKLYQERKLVKDLINLDKSRYGYLDDRLREIKMQINTEYVPIENEFFMPHNSILSNKITLIATKNIKELLKNTCSEVDTKNIKELLKNTCNEVDTK